jgi:NAD(P)-dependent dehydrogenase (short-subunit alcohol dehydrogenase family)
MADLSTRRAPIAGGTPGTPGISGIGKATAVLLGRLGASVIVVGRDVAKGRRVERELREANGHDQTTRGMRWG